MPLSASSWASSWLLAMASALSLYRRILRISFVPKLYVFVGKGEGIRMGGRGKRGGGGGGVINKKKI